ncbi:hypothetical protein IMCC3317_24300 [Kordia antarctica]|uniref:Uncharacterized protein n=1 Tax=Kordia antarctica TaxID=1218801 RepID=A0A7L4ZK87_9FLAO|nr:hypothetical protein [Kordia antarctica]QHI37052.1 hypothetical protein IMCC3317_24300 [Kordia antarctica]
MKSLRLLPIALLLLFSTSIFAQSSGAPREFESTSQIYDHLRKLLNTKEKEPYKIDWDNVKGSPYLYENYKMAQFYIGDKSYGTIMMRLNTYSNEVELLPHDGQEMEALMKVDGSRVVFEGKTLELFTYKDEEGFEKKAYFLVLNDEKNVQLLLRKKCKFSPNEKAPTRNQADRAAKFTQYDYYYIVKNGEPILVETKKKAVVKLFPEKESEIKKYIKSEKLKLKKEKDFAKLIDYVATL